MYLFWEGRNRLNAKMVKWFFLFQRWIFPTKIYNYQQALGVPAVRVEHSVFSPQMNTNGSWRLLNHVKFELQEPFHSLDKYVYLPSCKIRVPFLYLSKKRTLPLNPSIFNFQRMGTCFLSWLWQIDYDKFPGIRKVECPSCTMVTFKQVVDFLFYDFVFRDKLNISVLILCSNLNKISKDL